MFDIERVSGEIKKQGAKRVLIQVPEGLKTKALEIANKMEKEGIITFICIETCYGACDLRDKEAEKLGCDMILHIGHSDLGIKTKVPIIYEEFKINFNPIHLLEKNIDKLKPYKKISLTTTLQFISSLEKAKKFLESKGKRVFISKPKKAKYSGQVLGCDYSATKSGVDCFLFMGSGFFHPLGLAMNVEKPVLFLDFEKGILIDMRKEKERQQKIKFAQLEKAKEYKNFGILVSIKSGQFNLEIAEKIKQKLEKSNKNAFMLVFDEITPEKILGLKLDVLVNCACPRISDDFKMFKKIILNHEDVDRLLK